MLYNPLSKWIFYNHAINLQGIWQFQTIIAAQCNGALLHSPVDFNYFQFANQALKPALLRFVQTSKGQSFNFRNHRNQVFAGRQDIFKPAFLQVDHSVGV